MVRRVSAGVVARGTLKVESSARSAHASGQTADDQPSTINLPRPHGTSSTVSLFGPCAPRTRIRSISPVRLGPVMNEMKLG